MYRRLGFSLCGLLLLVSLADPVFAARSTTSSEAAEKKKARKKRFRHTKKKHRLQPKQSPTTHTRLYRIKKGDSLRKIARRLRVSVYRIRKLNPGLRRLRRGQQILVPARKDRFCQLTDGPGYRVLRPERAWGTLLTVTRLQDVAAAYARRFPDEEPLVFHDISSRRGGRMWPHRSHRNGRDVDVRMPLNYRTERYVKASPRTIDLERAWYVIRTLIDTGDVEYIFIDHQLQRALYRYAKSKGVGQAELDRVFQYPKKKDRTERAILYHVRGHRDHLHVRFKRGKRSTPPIS